MNISIPNNPALTSAVAPLDPISGSVSSATGNFADMMASAISQVEGTQATAEQAASDLLAGGRGDVHSVALAAQQAELSMEMFQQVRNKFVQAYQEVMKMPM